MSLSEIEQVMPETSDCRFPNLRGVQWRMNLGVLPSWSCSIDEFRRATAGCRRRYAILRRRLLMDPHVLKDNRNSANRFIDNPLSQNPDSTWGQFFRNAELEKTLDQDLSRLYPEHWCYFQAPGCQGMLRRILLLWCLKHPEYGYRQGMHELLAPLLYVLHVDIMRLSEVRKSYEDYFTDRFDSLSFEERDYTFGLDNFMDSMDDDIDYEGYSRKIKSLDELDPEVQSIVMLCDSYGAESELGIVLSEKFMEHDAYCMFDAFMSGNHGCVAMAGFFGYSPAYGSHTGLPPVLEACNAFYRLLAIVDSSLYNHLVELGVEPQYFGLRWLRVLFGREILLQDLLFVWDEIFSAENSVRTDSRNHIFMIFDSPRGSLVAGMAVSMILYLRSSLLSSENATSCLQRLLNFPENIDLNKIIHKAKSLQALVMDTNMRSALSHYGVFDQRSLIPARTKSLPCGSTIPKSPLIIAPESYWEEKWREHKAEEEERKIVLRKQTPPTQKKKRWSKITKLFRAVTDLSHYKTRKRVANSSPVIYEDLSQQHSPVLEEANAKNNLLGVDCLGTVEKQDDTLKEPEEGIMDFHSADGESLICGDASSEENSELTSIVGDSNYLENGSDDNKSVDSPSEENPTVSLEPTSPARDSFCIGNDSDSGTGSNLFPDENDKGQEITIVSSLSNEDDLTDISVGIIKEHKFLPGLIQWLWKFGRSLSSEESSIRNACDDATKTNGVESNKNQMGCYTESHHQALSSGSTGDSDQNLVKTLKNLGQSMLEHIQAIEAVFQQEFGPAQAGFIGNLAKTSMIGKGQVSATTALQELRKISSLLSEM